MVDTTVKYFDSTMSGAPTITNAAGSLIGVLDACLADGFGTISPLTSLVVSNNVATATYNSGHNFAMVGNTGPVIRISGSSVTGDNASALNGDWRVTVTSSTQFTFATSGVSNQTATGTITAKRAPAGWEKAFSGTNKAAYRSLDVTGTRLYLRIDDTGTTYARCRGYEAMTGVDSGTGLFPTDAQTSGGGYIHKSSSSSQRYWVVAADSRWATFMSLYDGTKITPFAFGDINSFHASDAYCCGIWMNNSSSTIENTGFGLMLTTTSSKVAMARGYAQTGTSIQQFQFSHQKFTSYLGQAGGTYPNPGTSELLLAPVEVWDNASVARGTYPGHYGPIHASANMSDGAIVSFSGRDILLRRYNVGGASNNGAVAIDITGPWR